MILESFQIISKELFELWVYKDDNAYIAAFESKTFEILFNQLGMNSDQELESSSNIFNFLKNAKINQDSMTIENKNEESFVDVKDFKPEEFANKLSIKDESGDIFSNKSNKSNSYSISRKNKNGEILFESSILLEIDSFCDIIEIKLTLSQKTIPPHYIILETGLKQDEIKIVGRLQSIPILEDGVDEKKRIYGCDFLRENLSGFLKNNLEFHKKKYVKFIRLRFGNDNEIKSSDESDEITILNLNIIGFDQNKIPKVDLESFDLKSKTLNLTLINMLLNPNFIKTVDAFSKQENILFDFQNKFEKIERIIFLETNKVNCTNFLTAFSKNEMIGNFIIDKILQVNLMIDKYFQVTLLKEILLKNNKDGNVRIKRLSKLLNFILDNLKVFMNEDFFYEDDSFFPEVLHIFCDCVYSFKTTLNSEISNNTLDQILKIIEKVNEDWKDALIRFIMVLLFQTSNNDLDEKVLYLLDKLWFQIFETQEAIPDHFNLITCLLTGIHLKCEWLSKEKLDLLAKTITEMIINENIYTNINFIRKEAFFGFIKLLGNAIIYRYDLKSYLINKNWHLKLFENIKNVENQETLKKLVELIKNIIFGFTKAELSIAELLLENLHQFMQKKQLFHFVFIPLLTAQSYIPISIIDPSDNYDKIFDNQKDSEFVSFSLENSILSQINQKEFLDNFKEITHLDIHSDYSWSLTLKINEDSFKLKEEMIEKVLERAPFLLLVEGSNAEKPCSLVIYCHSPVDSKPSKSSSLETIYTIPNNSLNFVWYSENDMSLFFKTQNLKNKAANLEIWNSGSGLVFFLDEKETFFMSFEPGIASYLYLNPFETKPIKSKKGLIREIAQQFLFKRAEFWSLKENTHEKIKSNYNLRKEILEDEEMVLIESGPLQYFRSQPVFIVPNNLSISQISSLFFLEPVNLYFNKTNEILNPDTHLSDLWEVVLKEKDIIIDLEWRIQSSIIKTEKNLKKILIEKEMPLLNAFVEIKGVDEFFEILIKNLFFCRSREKVLKWLFWIREIYIYSRLSNFFSCFFATSQNIQIFSNILEENLPLFENKHYIIVYQLLIDIFNHDKTWDLRKNAIENGILNLILQKIEEITGEKPRKYAQKTLKSDLAEITKKVISLKINELSTIGKKKGIGYATETVTNIHQKESIVDCQENSKNRSELLQICFDVFYEFIDFEKGEPENLIEPFICSALLPYLENSFRSSSLLDVSKNLELFLVELKIVKKISEHNPLTEILLDLEISYQPKQIESIYLLLSKLKDLASNFLTCIQNISETIQDSQQLKIANEIISTYEFVTKSIETFEKKSNFEYYIEELNVSQEKDIKNLLDLPLNENYPLFLNELKFDYISMKDSSDVLKHHYSQQPSGSNTTKLLRLAQEFAELSLSLPISHTDAIFIRCDTNRIDLMKALIIGVKDTPYEHGAYEYHIFFEDSYPNTPPKVNLETTGNGQIRFNPNLYCCGKVCLSLLGTWRGNSSENWNPKVSTILQVLMSLQSIVMTEEIYFNEPGFEGEAGTSLGEKKNEGYCNIVRYGNARFAILEQIKKPSLGFEDVIRRHFYLKRKEILNDCEKWLERALNKEADYTGLVKDHNNQWATEFKKSKTQYYDMLKMIVNDIEKELANLETEVNLKLIFQNKFQIHSNVHKKKIIKRKPNEILAHKEYNLSSIDVTFDKKILNKDLDISDENVKDRWSRYIGAMGLDSITKQAKSKVFLLGLGPLGIEIAKNLVLSGLQLLTIYDNTLVSSNDFSGHFFLEKNDIGSSRAEASLNKLQQLNPYVKVNHFKGNLDEEAYSKFKDFDIFVLTEGFYSLEEKLNRFCRIYDIKFISSLCHGVFSKIFIDFGEEFEILDKNGEECQEVFIKNISSDIVGQVDCIDSMRHKFEDGDLIVLNEVLGMEGINGSIHKITVINSKSFLIGNTSNYSKYIRNGIAKQVKEKIKMNFKSLETVEEESLKDIIKYHDKYILGNDKEKESILHLCFRKLKGYESQIEFEKEEFLDSAAFLKYFEKDEENVTETKFSGKYNELIKKFSICYKKNFPPLIAMIGGIVCHEVLKGITHKHTPINQLFFMEISDLVPANLNESFKLEDNFTNCREAHLISFLGNELINSIKYCRLFLVGSGAIGCELVKNFAMISLGTGVSADSTQSGHITLTDPDVIEPSNLNRQFLFREKHLRQSKSLVAAASAIQMNPNLKDHITPFVDRVQESTENIFDDEFFMSISIISNALDNIEARKYVDSLSIKHKVPLLDSGTLGTKGHVQVIVPYITESYGSQEDPKEDLSNEIPQCTLKMFPETNIHCIEWALDKFSKLFQNTPSLIKQWLDGLIVVCENLDDSQELDLIEKLTNAVEKIPKDFDECLFFAIKKFEKYFVRDIKKLMEVYPLEHKTNEGNLFWNLPKRPPLEIKFDMLNDLHINFICSLAFVKANSMGIPLPSQNFKELKQKNFLQFLVHKSFVIKKEITEKKENSESKAEEKKEYSELKAEEKKLFLSNINKNEFLKKIEKLKNFRKIFLQKNMKISPQIFEKDQIENFHVDVIYSLCNCRATNYGLPIISWLDVKLKAGKIVPALPSTTACIAGLQTIELIKVLKGLSFEFLRNSFVNLAVPLIQFSEPIKAPHIKLNEKFSVSLWDRWDIYSKVESNLKLIEFNEILITKYALWPKEIFVKNRLIYSSMSFKYKKNVIKSILEEKLIDLIENTEISKAKYVDMFIIFSKGENDNEMVKGTPPVRVWF